MYVKIDFQVSIQGAIQTINDKKVSIVSSEIFTFCLILMLLEMKKNIREQY